MFAPIEVKLDGFDFSKKIKTFNVYWLNYWHNL